MTTKELATKIVEAMIVEGVAPVDTAKAIETTQAVIEEATTRWAKAAIFFQR